MATDFEALIPVGVASELIAAAERESVAMRLGNVQRMPEGIESVPVVSVEPDAEWNALGARKKATTIEWSALRLESESSPASWRSRRRGSTTPASRSGIRYVIGSPPRSPRGSTKRSSSRSRRSRARSRRATSSASPAPP
jgi:hypothetical protein